MEAAVRHWETFWRGTNKRPAVSAVVPKPGVTPVTPPGWYTVMPERDPNPAMDRLLGWAETHDFLAEAIPHYYLEFGCDHFAALLGGDMKYTDDKTGGWAVPAIRDLASADIRFDREGYWWRKMRSPQVFFSLDAKTRTEVEDCLAALEAATAEKPEPPGIRRRDG
jgi:hypothetical protein